MQRTRKRRIDGLHLRRQEPAHRPPRPARSTGLLLNVCAVPGVWHPGNYAIRRRPPTYMAQGAANREAAGAFRECLDVGGSGCRRAKLIPDRPVIVWVV